MYTVKRPGHILLTKVGISLGPGLILNGHFQQTNVAVKTNVPHYVAVESFHAK
jgi:hypothetical protein